VTFVPRDFVVGDHVRITSDIANEEGTFQAGHEFEIFDLHIRSGEFVYDLRDRDLHELGDVPLACLQRIPGYSA
jgi:hypothetical protein